MSDVLIDDVALVQGFLSGSLPGHLVTRRLTENATSQYPVVLYELTGTDSEVVVNGPGLWDVALKVTVIAGSDSAAWAAAKAVDAVVVSWDQAGNGWTPGVGGVVRAARSQKFSDVYEASVFDKDAHETDAVFSLRMQSLDI